MSGKQSVARKTIPLCGIVLVLGIPVCGTIGIGVDVPIAGHAQTAESSSAQPELIALIQNFLNNVPNNERSTFDRFFADDVIYTRGTGEVVTKKDILADIGSTKAGGANATFTGEDFHIHQYGDTAVVNFRLLMHATENSQPPTRSFRNTGIFMKRNGQWQAIAWQATPITKK